MSVVMHGGEPFFYPGGKTGCLLIHGFTASPQEMRFLGESLASDGYTVHGVRLFGHATTIEDMQRARWHDWLASVEDGYQLLQAACERIVVIGFSQGGVLALRFCAEQEVNALITISTPFELPPDRRLQFLRPFLRPLSALIGSIPKGAGKWVDETLAAERVAYQAYPLRSVVELDYLLADMRSHLHLVNAPLLSIHSHRDDFVPPENLAKIQAGVGSTYKEAAWVNRSYHLITSDADREFVLEYIRSFIREQVSSPA